jgi:methionyl-tRNA formyltransferase
VKIVFIGTVELSLKVLEKLVEIEADIVGVITKREAPFNSDYADLTPICESNNILYKYSEDINSAEEIAWIKKQNPDVLFCFGWSWLLGKQILNIVPLGVIGFHPAALPRNRGRHPIIWALALGLETTASTFFFMDAGADSGDILSQVKIDVTYEDDARSLYNKVIDCARNQVEEFVPLLAKGTFNRIPQNDYNANYCRKRTPADGKIDFRMSSRSIYNLVRALTRPYIGAHVVYGNHEIKIWRAQEIKMNLKNIEPGKILEVSDRTILVKCGQSAIRLVEHDFVDLPSVGKYFL